MIQGASKVMVVDRHADRLALAAKIGCIPIDDSKGSPVDLVLEQTRGKGADRGCECVGYQCTNARGHEVPNLTMNNLVNSVRFTGGIGVVGIFLPKDPGGADKLARARRNCFRYGPLLV
jgi:threonine dehydrogenase-like Zn-dependent dehydrogenase